MVYPAPTLPLDGTETSPCIQGPGYVGATSGNFADIAGAPKSILRFAVGHTVTDASWTAAAAAGVDIYVPAGTYSIPASVVFTASVEFATGAVVNGPTGGATITFNGNFEAPRSQVFGANLTVKFGPASISVGLPEWWGAIPNDPSFDCEPAISACLASVQTTQLNAADYWTQSTIYFSESNKVLQGFAGTGRDVGVGVPTRLGQPGATRVILTGSNVQSSTVIVFGQTVLQPYDNASLTRNSYISDISFCRDCSTYLSNPSSSGDPINCVKGVIMSYASACVLTNVSSYDSPCGFHLFGCVTSTVRDCSSYRTTPASSATNDFSVGCLVGGYNINYGYVGNNASLYIQHFVCYDAPSGTSTSWGMRLFGAFADTFLINCEVGRRDYGIEFDGRSSFGGTAWPYSTGPGAQQDVSLINCIIDSTTVAAIYIHDCNDSCQIGFTDLYVSEPVGTAIEIANIGSGTLNGGNISFYGGRILGGPGTTGLSISTANNLAVFGTYFRDFANPFVASSVYSAEFRPDIVNLSTPSTNAVELTTVQRSIIAPRINGASGVFTVGVNMVGTSCAFNSVDGSGINYGAMVTVSPTQKVQYNGTTAVGNSAFTAADNVLIGATG